jgi:hypothetical protein
MPGEGLTVCMGADQIGGQEILLMNMLQKERQCSLALQL